MGCHPRFVEVCPVSNVGMVLIAKSLEPTPSPSCRKKRAAIESGQPGDLAGMRRNPSLIGRMVSITDVSEPGRHFGSPGGHLPFLIF